MSWFIITVQYEQKFFLFSTYSSLILNYLLNWTLNQNRKPLISGPYGFMFAALIVYIFEIPPTAHMKIFNIVPISDKQTIYLLVIQFLLTNFPHSLLPAVSGIISGTVYQYLLCNIFKLDRKFKFPAFLVKFASEVVKPLIQATNYQSSSTRSISTVNRNITSSNQGNQQQPQNIMHDNFSHDDHLSNLHSNVSEDNIQQLMNMGFSRTQCEIALRQANNDIHLATELLLHE
ncbi:hypothetical protein C9374_003727 [Naegleria lovaniensis]|uniref:UBA domain-containing protein n=1 Tax=Naegleria lovaniensis TaxID=51637 RepID=A0AA88GZM8_NAELO|nr:uncharacterized protein C9374_003727 [Naegleria lovaniensis]KAG2393963.1 hypothetical protein C9374_003727 [Naegleria lovaniensis]